MCWVRFLSLLNTFNNVTSFISGVALKFVISVHTWFSRLIVVSNENVRSTLVLFMPFISVSHYLIRVASSHCNYLYCDDFIKKFYIIKNLCTKFQLLSKVWSCALMSKSDSQPGPLFSCAAHLMKESGVSCIDISKSVWILWFPCPILVIGISKVNSEHY